mgnify:FL=1
MRGLMHIYCGDGKGKTTAAVGLAVRASGTGKKVLFVQFMKGGKTGELQTFQKLSDITVLRSDKKFPFYHQMTDEQKKEQTAIHNAILEKAAQALEKGEFEILILDEVTYPYQWEMLDRQKLIKLLDHAKAHAEAICTGRNPAQELLSRADYITEMKCMRHPYEKGIAAREGIEY